ncbi:prepilin-type N-terminal cleavage/methylation domain-containing protein [Enterobacter chuandaensis]|uniref:PulJ/GspJ family protein n=1 Tax=Enterobacter chuandaensis TaxID=2497875 RepID=UPI0020756399|nr:type II secretion system protein GspJ [Enterobacter chuandaensis]MCM7591004.1 prepilin-type N-terminal cleavage/methylation domain-containing protein [Enterobacter chuandaensis]
MSKETGFTLLEVMLAIAIFSTLSFLASLVFSQATEQHQRAQTVAEKFNALQRTERMLNRDLTQYVPRNNRQTNQPMFIETEGMIFSTLAPDSTAPFDVTPNLVTVHWFVKDGVLYRAVRPTADSDKQMPSRPMLNDVSHFTARFQTSEDGGTPSTISITLELQDQEQIRRIYILPPWFPKVQENSPLMEAAK